jgi:predicted component of type VI protein secretion system
MNYKVVLVDSANGSDQSYWILPPPITVGRSPTAEVSIGDASISRRHCQFSNDSQGALVVRDLNSTNGIYIDDRRVTKAVLKPGDVVRLGAITLRIEWTDDDVFAGPTIGKSSHLDVTQPLQAIPRDQKK